MNSSVLTDLIEKGSSISIMATELGVSKATVRHWMKKHGLKTHNSIYNKGKTPSFKCCECGETNPSKFYGHKRSICGKCQNQYNIETGRKKKEYIVEALGGRCSYCGYNKYIGALDIHHLDPTIKDKNFGSIRGWSKSRIDKEIENCVLLCANCHREEHGYE